MPASWTAGRAAPSPSPTLSRPSTAKASLTRTTDSLWQPAEPTRPQLIDAVIVSLVRAEASQPIPYTRMRKILTAAGPNPSGSGGGPVMQYHPLVHSVSYGRWALRDHQISTASL